LLRFISILHGHSSRYRMLLVRGLDQPGWLDDHEAILRAARRQDADRAVRMLERQTRDGLAMLVRTYGASLRGRRAQRPTD